MSPEQVCHGASLVLGWLCVLVPARAAALLLASRAAPHVPLVLAAFAVGALPLAAVDEGSPGWLLLSQCFFVVAASLASGGVAWFLVERAAEELTIGPPEKRLGRGMTEERWKALIAAWTLAGVAALCALYRSGGIRGREGPLAGLPHDAASLWAVAVFWLCVGPAHALVGWLGFLLRGDPDLRPVPRHLVVYGASGVLFPALMLLIRLDLPFMRGHDGLADAALWAVELAGLHAISQCALIAHDRARDTVERAGGRELEGSAS